MLTSTQKLPRLYWLILTSIAGKTVIIYQWPTSQCNFQPSQMLNKFSFPHPAWRTQRRVWAGTKGMKVRMAPRSTKPLASILLTTLKTLKMWWLAIHITRADCITTMATTATNSTTTKRDSILWAKTLARLRRRSQFAATRTCSKEADGETLEWQRRETKTVGRIQTERTDGRVFRLLVRTRLSRQLCVGRRLGRRQCCRHFTRWELQTSYLFPPLFLTAHLLRPKQGKAVTGNQLASQSFAGASPCSGSPCSSWSSSSSDSFSPTLISTESQQLKPL